MTQTDTEFLASYPTATIVTMIRRLQTQARMERPDGFLRKMTDELLQPLVDERNRRRIQ